MVRITKNGISHTAAQNPPSLPDNLKVHGIGGLQPFLHAHKHSRFVTPSNRTHRITSSSHPVVHTNSLEEANHPPFLPKEILRAYNADRLNLTGKGQTIAILIDTLPLDSDLTTFWKECGSSTTLEQIEKVNVKGGDLPQREGEETLDVSWTSGIAPDAKIRVYASGSLSFTDLDRALDQLLADLPSRPDICQLSISLGLGESYMQKAEMRTQHQKFLRLAAAGVNVFISSGDAGSNPSTSGHDSNGPLQAEYSASDSAVIAVGGTSLYLQPQSEVGWPDSGGGLSSYFQRPVWQKDVLSGSFRAVPDVSAVADPNTGCFLVLNNKVVQYGGTSWSAPIWAGFCALLNEARVKANKSPLPFLNPLLYPLANKPSFRDIVSGSNGAYKAGKGYDLVTGLGVPNLDHLLQELLKV